jgi:hypothetical protein
MDAQTDVGAVAVGSALVGLWLAVRLQRFAPAGARGAGLCFVLAWLSTGFAGPLFAAALLHLPAGLAVLATVFPVLVVTFALAAWVLRYLIGLLAHTVR